ncbi:MAG: hypothetical protein MJE77_23260 [Proteobacteria bacterium]|nr:hypothetical protein [Pseudomonadota bacterium]
MAGDGGLAQAILALEGTNHTSLVQGSQSISRPVGYQKEPLVLHGMSRFFDHDRDLRVTALVPVRQALEAVEHFVGAVFRRGNANRQWRCIVACIYMDSSGA